MKFSKQTQKVYEILLKEREGLTVVEIASKLRIAAGDVYRLAKPLLGVGLIEKIAGRPIKFFAKPADTGLGLFLMSQSQWFQSLFKPIKFSLFHSKKEEANMQLEFVLGRDELMRVSVDEVIKTTNSVDLLRSGHEIPPDLMLAMVQAISRGVKIRMIIQDYGPENRQQVENWIKNGILVRETDLKHLRLMLYDTKVGYFMSYKHSDSGRDMGMKIVYPPFAAILQGYFDKLWKSSVKIL